jgi:hypothetical protein
MSTNLITEAEREVEETEVLLSSPENVVRLLESIAELEGPSRNCKLGHSMTFYDTTRWKRAGDLTARAIRHWICACPDRVEEAL